MGKKKDKLKLPKTIYAQMAPWVEQPIATTKEHELASFTESTRIGVYELVEERDITGFVERTKVKHA